MTLGKLLAEVHREYANYRRPEGVCVSLIELSGPQDRNQIHRHQKPTRRHTDKGKFHT